MDPEECYWTTGREGEWVCPHGIGHPLPGERNPIHGCDGCCRRDDFPQDVDDRRKAAKKEV